MNDQLFRHWILVIFFFLGISFPFLNEAFQWIDDVENTENRKPAEKPIMDIQRLDDFPPKYDKFYTDTFTFRQRLIQYFTALNLSVFHKSPVPDQVVIGNNGWLFMAGNEVDAYRVKNKFTKEELEEIRLELMYRKTYLKERNCEFYFALAPVKANIYPEEMPAGLFKLNQQSMGEQLNEYLKKHSSVNVVDLFTVLRENKKHGLMYFKLDNHWNQKGAFFAANELFHQISKNVSSIKPLGYQNFSISNKIIQQGNIASMLSNTHLFSDSSLELSPLHGFLSKAVPPKGYPCVENFPYCWEYELNREIEGSKKPKVLLICDSFGGHIFPFISENFSRSVKIFDAWQYKLNEVIVKAEKPDVVILIALESNIRGMLKYQSRVP